MTIQGKAQLIHTTAPPLPYIGSERMSAEEDLPVISLTDLVRVLRTRKLIVIGTAALVVAITALVVSQLTPLYRATAYVMVDPKRSNVTDTAAVIGGLPTDSPSTVENQMQILQSRALAGVVVDKLSLMGALDAVSPPQPEGPTFREKLDPAYWLGQDWLGARWLEWFQASALGLFGADAQPIEAAPAELLDPKDALVNQLRANLSVRGLGRSTAIAITFESSVPQSAALVANTLASSYIEDQVSVKSDATQNASQWLAARLNELSAQSQTSERMVELYKAEHKLMDTAPAASGPGATIVQQQLSALNMQLINAQADLAEQEARYNQVMAMKESGRSADVSQVVASSLISQLRQQEVEIFRQEAELSTKYGPSHPRILDLQSQKQNLSAKIDEEVRRVVETVQNDVVVARARVRSLQDSLANLGEKVQAEDLARVKLTELTSAAASNKAVFEAFLERFKEIEGSDALQEPDARVISHATVPFSPSFPNKTLFFGAAVPGGLLLGLLLAMMLDSLVKGFRTQEQVERVLSLPVLAALPEVTGSTRSKRRSADQVISNPMSSYAEAVRGLQIGLMLSEKPPKVVVVASSVPSEGKTTVAISLARIASRSLQRVILVDGDLRQPSIVRTMNIPRPQFGIAEALTGTPVEECLVKDPLSDVRILSAQRLRNPSDILSSERLATLIGSLSESCDLLVIDSSPLLATNDARILAQFADSVLFVVRWERTSRDAALHALRSLNDAMAPVAGVVVSRADWEQFHYYNYGRVKYRQIAKYYRD
jgi:succinoglycan biosynthesis transport protein ExoP